MSANTEDGQENSEVTNSLLHSLCNTLSDRSSIDWLIGWLNHWIMALSKNELFMTRNWCQYFCKFYQNPRKFAAHPMSIVAKRLDWSWHLARGWALVQATCARWGPSSPPPKRGQSLLIFVPFYCGQTARCIKMPLGTVELAAPHVAGKNINYETALRWRPNLRRLRLGEEKRRTRMWADAQRDARPAKYRWRPLFNAAKFGWRPILECRAVTLPRRETRCN